MKPVVNSEIDAQTTFINSVSTAYYYLENLYREGEIIIDQNRNLLSSFGNSSTPQQCDAGKWCLSDNFCITEVSLIPTCLLALLIGTYTSNQIKTRFANVKGSWMYAVTFLCFAIMMTDSMLVHCFIPRPNIKDRFFIVELIVNLINLAGTTSIAVGFFFCGLSDINWINADSIQSKVAFSSSFVAVFIAWYLALINQWKNMFLILYGGLVGLFCGIYLIIQLIILARRTVREDEQNELKGILYFIACGVSGAVGLGSVFVWRSQICSMMGPVLSPYLGPTFSWFILSDVAVYCLFKYVEQAMTLKCGQDTVHSSHHNRPQQQSMPPVQPQYNPYAHMHSQSPMVYLGGNGKMYTYSRVATHEEDVPHANNQIEMMTHRQVDLQNGDDRYMI